MKTQTKNNSSNSTQIALSAAAIVLVAAFCYIVKLPLIIPLLLLMAGIHLHYFKKAEPKLFLRMGLLISLIVFTAHAITKYYANISPFYIPVASIAMLVILLYNDLQLSFLMAFLSSIFVGLIAGSDFGLMIITFVGSLLSVYYVKDARTRGHLIKAGFFTGGIQVLSAILLYPAVLDPAQHIIFTNKPFLNYMVWLVDVGKYLKPLLLNGLICAFVVMATSKVFELLFGVLTNFSLLEMADFNQPLLRKLVLDAPGTYHHSLVVSNIAEAAADAIGANALLTRVGAYYHDIGKTIKPEYFTENQTFDASKHDHLEPTMSRLVILNHVKEGVDLAKKHKLNQKIIDFIPQHHGTGLIYYFYQRALEGAQEGEVVDQANFRYPGPKPQNRETAIVLLADSVEGAVRALDDPTRSRIDEVVRKVVNNKFIDGQLDECDLTLKNLERICSTFTRVLGAMYHSRVKYPEKKNGNENHSRKSPEEDSSLSQPDFPAGPENP